MNVIYILLVRCRKHKYLIQREFRSQDIHIANMMSITQKNPGLMLSKPYVLNILYMYSIYAYWMIPFEFAEMTELM